MEKENLQNRKIWLFQLIQQNKLKTKEERNELLQRKWKILTRYLFRVVDEEKKKLNTSNSE